MVVSLTSITLSQLLERLQREASDLVQGYQLEGPVDVTLETVVHPANASKKTDLVYVPTVSALQALQLTDATVAVIEASLRQEEAAQCEELLKQGASFLVVPRLRVALALLLNVFNKPAALEVGIHPTAEVDPTAELDDSVRVGAYCVVGPNTVLSARVSLYPHTVVGADVTIGADSVLHSGVRLGDRVELGKRVVIQSNAVIASDGFSYVTPQAGSVEAAKQSGGDVTAQNTDILRINSIGTVVLEDDVEIGACTTIDRGTLAETRIAKGTKIDNLVQIGHNNTVGQNCLIVSQVGLAGSCNVGDRVVIAGQSGFADHLTIGDDSIVMARSGVMRDVEPKTIVAGSPAMPRKQAFETVMYSSKLKAMYQDIKALKKQLKTLEASLADAAREEASTV